MMGWPHAVTAQHARIQRRGVETFTGPNHAAVSEAIEAWQRANPDKLIVGTRPLNTADGLRVDASWRMNDAP